MLSQYFNDQLKKKITDPTKFKVRHISLIIILGILELY